MRKGYKIIISVVILLVLAISYGIHVYNKPHVNVEKAPTDVKIEASDLIASFIHNEDKANDDFVEKVIEVEGTVKDIKFKNNKNKCMKFKDNQSKCIEFKNNKIKCTKLKSNFCCSVKMLMLHTNTAWIRSFWTLFGIHYSSTELSYIFFR